VVGGGITGLTAAYLLTAAGKTVAVIERERCARVDTGHTSAHLSMVTDEGLTALVKRFGRDHAEATWDAGLAAIGQIDAIVADLQIPCDFAWLPAYLHPPVGQPVDDAVLSDLRQEARLASELGFDAEFLKEVPLAGGPGIRYDGQARFHPRKYLNGLARAIADRGGMIFEHSAAEAFCDDPLSVTSNGHTLTCGDIVLATHTPLMGNAGTLSATLLQTKLALYTTYVIGGRVEKGRIPDALFWDTADPYHYLRIEPDSGHDVVISNSRGPESLSELVAELGSKARAVTVVEAARSGDIVVVTIPLKDYRTVPVEPLAGKIVIDTNNYYPERDGHIPELDNESATTSELLQRHLPTSKIVKAFNHIYAAELTTHGQPAGTKNRRALAIAGNDQGAKTTVTHLLDQFGFDIVDTGPLKEGWRIQRDTPGYGPRRTAEELRRDLAAAKRYADQ